MSSIYFFSRLSRVRFRTRWRAVSRTVLSSRAYCLVRCFTRRLRTVLRSVARPHTSFLCAAHAIFRVCRACPFHVAHLVVRRHASFARDAHVVFACSAHCRALFAHVTRVRASFARCRAVSRVVNSPHLNSLVLIKLLT
jgi:hypothetical protein